MMDLLEKLQTIYKFREYIPVDVEKLAKTLGLGIKYDSLSPNISGIIEKEDNGFIIRINRNDPLTRQRFTIAHEIGHYMLHLDKIGEGVSDNQMYRSIDNNLISPKEETQANQFAIFLLMPNHLIQRLQDQGITDYKEMAQKLGVSQHAMAIRLGVDYKLSTFKKR